MATSVRSADSSPENSPIMTRPPRTEQQIKDRGTQAVAEFAVGFFALMFVAGLITLGAGAGASNTAALGTGTALAVVGLGGLVAASIYASTRDE